jgi:hypothetical protein
MKRTSRFLQRNEGTETPSNLIFVDTESRIEDIEGSKGKKRLTLRLWVAIRVRIEKERITRRVVRHGKTQDEFWRFVDDVSDVHRTTWIFAHNLAFDCTQLGFWQRLDVGWFGIQPIYATKDGPDGTKRITWMGKLCLDVRPCFMSVRNGRKTYRLVDTCNYWPKRLYEIGEDLGLEKLSLPVQSDSESVWLQYCTRDAQIIEAAVCNLLGNWRRERCGVFQMTAPMLAMTNFRHICDIRTPEGNALDILCEPNHKSHELEREAYFGGRTTCYFVGEVRGRIYHVDVNSLYPAMMREHLFPRRFIRYECDPKISDVRAGLRIFGVVARCLINSQKETYPVRIDGKQHHCTGIFWASLCGPELQRALETNSVERISLVQYYSVAPLFRKWVDYWYGKKLEASVSRSNRRGDYEFAKLILNSLSGKWAQHGRHWQDAIGEYPLVRWGGYHEYDVATKRYIKCRGVGGNKQFLTEGSEPAHAFPLISAYITAYAREFMYAIIRSLPLGSVYYMATDSLILDEQGYHSLQYEGLVSDTELGKFKLCGVYDTCRIHGPNWYQLNGKTVATGLLGKAIAARKGTGKVDVWEQVPSIIGKGPVDEVIVTETDIPAIVPSFRGIVGDDGYWNPYRITMDPDFSDKPPKQGYRFSDSTEEILDRLISAGQL